MDEKMQTDVEANQATIKLTNTTTTTNIGAPTTNTTNVLKAADSTPTENTTSMTDESLTTTTEAAAGSSSKTLKRCLSVPTIHTVPGGGTASRSNVVTTMTTRSAAAAARNNESMLATPKKAQIPDSTGLGQHIHIPRSNPCSREVSPAPVFNIFAPRTRRYSASYSPLNANAAAAAAVNAGNAGAAGGGTPLCLTPRVSQLRQEECVDMNSREVNHEREVHSAMQMSQSWEDLTLVTENWSCKSDEFSNPLQVALPSSGNSCSSPSPTSNRAGLRLPYGLSPSPTRRTFATRRSMSPIAMRPSQLGPVKRKFELEDNSSSNWNVYSPPPLKKIFTESRGSSPVCQSPSSVCPSPDSGTYDGRITPKLFISKLCTTNTNNSTCSSPMSASPSINNAAIDSTATSTICSSSSSSSSASSISGGSEPMCISSNIDEGISINETDDNKTPCASRTNASATTMTTTQANADKIVQQRMSTDMQDEATLMDDIKSETSSIGGCSSVSIESSSCDSGAKAAATFLHKLVVDDIGVTTTSTLALGQKNFFINKQGLSGAKKFIVNHDNLPNSNNAEHYEGNNVSSTTSAVAVAAAEAVAMSCTGSNANGSGNAAASLL